MAFFLKKNRGNEQNSAVDCNNNDKTCSRELCRGLGGELCVDISGNCCSDFCNPFCQEARLGEKWLTASALARVITGHHGKLRLAVQAIYYYLRLLRLREVHIADELLSIAAQELKLIDELSVEMEGLGFSPKFSSSQPLNVSVLNRGCLLSDKVKRKEVKILLLDLVSSITAHVNESLALFDKTKANNLKKGGELEQKILSSIEKEKENINRLLSMAATL